MATSNDSTTHVGGYSATAASNVPPDSGATGKRFQGAAEIRQLKKVLKDTFSAITGAVTASHTEINALTGSGISNADLVKLAAVTASASEINGATGDIAAVMQYAAGQGYMLPNWDTTFTPADEPTVVEMTEDGATGRKMKWEITYTSGDPTQIVWSYDAGAGYAVLTGGTQTINYDVDGNVTGVTSI